MKGNTCPTKPLRASSRATPPQLSDSLVGGFRSNPKWTKAQSAYIRDRHLNTYADIVTWSGNHWTWRLLDLPQPLQELLLPVPLPVEESIPLLPGQAWHLIAPDQLFSNRITEILSVSMYLTPSGYTVDVLYRHWILPQAVTSPLPRTIISSVSPPQLYHGPTDHASWFSTIFGPSPQRVSLVTLILFPERLIAPVSLLHWPPWILCRKL